MNNKLMKLLGYNSRSLEVRKVDFITKAKEVHGDKYDYSKVVYVNSKVKVMIICHGHGEFCQTPNNHSCGKGCPKCKASKPCMSTRQFIDVANKIHSSKYNYNNTNYIDARTKVEIICPEHGEFMQKPTHHIHGLKPTGCPICGGSKLITTDGFIKTSEMLHNNKYDYAKVDYVNNITKVTIGCPEHGDFYQTPKDHLRGNECIKCTHINPHTIDSFVSKSIVKHGDKYDYSKVKNFTTIKDKVEILCPTHGSFLQVCESHYNGKGCPKCGLSIKQSKLELEILDFIKYNYSGTVIEGDRSVLDGKELDIYLPDKRVAIEVNGIYHHAFQVPENHHYAKPETLDIRGKEPYPGTLWLKPANYHQKKHAMCRDKGIRLISIWDFFWDANKQHHYKDMILNAIGCNAEVIYARKCKVIDLTYEQAYEFFDRRSFHGKTTMPRKNAILKALEYKGEIVMGMASNHITVQRMVTETGVRVVGGLSRLMKHCQPCTTYFTTNDSGSITRELPGWKSVEYKNRRGWLVKGKTHYRDIWLNHDKVEKIVGVGKSRKGEHNGYWNAMVAEGYYYMADSGLTKMVKI